MYYLSRSDPDRGAFYVVDTDDNIEERVSLAQLTKLHKAGVFIEGLEWRNTWRNGLEVTVADPYIPSSQLCAKTVLVYGLLCHVRLDGTLACLRFKEHTRNSHVKLSKFCRKVGSYSISAVVQKVGFTLIFDDSLAIEKDIFCTNGSYDRGGAGQAEAMTVLDIRELSDKKAERIYDSWYHTLIRPDITDDNKRFSDNMGRLAYKMGFNPDEPNELICNRKIWPHEFDELYKYVSKGIPPANVWNNNTDPIDPQEEIDFLIELRQLYASEGHFWVRGQDCIEYLLDHIAGDTKGMKLLSRYCICGGDDKRLLDYFDKWLSKTIEVLPR